MKENDANHRNIFVTKFKENEITNDLEKIALYTAGSITSADCGIAFVDENTFSSMIETRKGLSPIALANESKVLAVYDFTFITEPYDGILDNNQLIANIADWLTSPIKYLEKCHTVFPFILTTCHFLDNSLSRGLTNTTYCGILKVLYNIM